MESDRPTDPLPPPLPPTSSAKEPLSGYGGHRGAHERACMALLSLSLSLSLGAKIRSQVAKWCALGHRHATSSIESIASGHYQNLTCLLGGFLSTGKQTSGLRYVCPILFLSSGVCQSLGYSRLSTRTPACRWVAAERHRPSQKMTN